MSRKRPLGLTIVKQLTDTNTDVGRGLGPFWVSLLIIGVGGRIPAFNLSLAGWFACAIVLFCMTFTVRGDLRKLEATTAATADRHRLQPHEGSIVSVKEVHADTLGADGPLSAQVMDNFVDVEDIPEAEINVSVRDNNADVEEADVDKMQSDADKRVHVAVTVGSSDTLTSEKRDAEAERSRSSESTLPEF